MARTMARLAYFWTFCSTYSSIKRMMRQIVIMSAPNATVPKWNLQLKFLLFKLSKIFLLLIYLIVRVIDSVNEKNGRFFVFFVQYQVANTPANTISLNAVIKNIIQKNPKMFNPWKN